MRRTRQDVNIYLPNWARDNIRENVTLFLRIRTRYWTKVQANVSRYRRMEHYSEACEKILDNVKIAPEDEANVYKQTILR